MGEVFLVPFLDILWLQQY